MTKTSLAAISLLLLALGFVHTENEAEKATEGIREELLQSVVSIEVISSDGKGRPIGTGFLMAHPSGLVALFTAKHVLREPHGAPRTNLGYRLNVKGNPSVLLPSSYAEEMGSPWFHSETYDVSMKFIAFPAHISDFKMIGEDFFLAQDRVKPGAPVMIAGFPLGQRSEEHTDPIVRRGIVALSHTNRLLLDAFTFPGNSGGPVFYVPTIKVPESYKPNYINTEMLMGMVSRQLSYVEAAISPQTGRPRVTFEDNAGLTEIVPSDAIRDLLTREDVEKRARTLRPDYGE